MIRTIAIGASLLLCMSTMPLRCSSDTEPTSGGGEFKKTTGGATVDVGLTYDVSGSGANKKVDITNTTGEHIKGCIVFVDAAGNIVSQTAGIMPAGGTLSVPVPDGATDQYVTDEEDCGCGGGGAPVGPLVSASSTPRRARFRQGFCLVPTFTGEPNVEHRIHGVSANPTAFYQDAQYLVDGGYRRDSSIHPGVSEVDAVLSEVIVHPGFDLELTLASNIPFLYIELWINGIPVRDMTDAYVPPIVGSGWDAWSFSLPSSTPGFHYDPAAGESWSNEIEFQFVRPGDSSMYTFRRWAEYTSD